MKQLNSQRARVGLPYIYHDWQAHTVTVGQLTRCEFTP